jgi:tRNA (guanine6-N2)-methyltransferase
MHHYTNKPPPHTPAIYHLEVVVAAGLEELARAELRQLGRSAQIVPSAEAGLLQLRYHGNLRSLLELQLATSVYMVHTFAVPRPRALLGDQQLRTIQQLSARVIGLHPPGSFRTLYLSAAGGDSTILSRLKGELAAGLGLTVGSDDGDLLVRLRREPEGGGWQFLVRISPRPLATRAWRVCNREGALNGPVAHAMALLTHPTPSDRYLNLGCGSGSLLIERLRIGPARSAIGCDRDATALRCAQANLAAAGLATRCELHNWDVRALPLPAASIDVVSADLPFGHLVGSHEENLRLYPALLAEAARVACPGARCVVLSHEVRLMERLLAQQNSWQLEQMVRVDLGGLFPRIVQLRRT